MTRGACSTRHAKPTIRFAREADAEQIWQLVRECPELDTNSFYCYYLLCTHFSSTCIVAEQAGRLIGFVTGFISPSHSDVCFVWQAYVDADARARGTAGALLDYLLRSQPHLPRFIEATVAPDNTASRRTFQALARRFGAAFEETPLLPASAFPGNAHSAENLIHIGPLSV